MTKRKIAVLSGGYDPIHSGHLAMFEHARKISDYVVAAVNSDEWLRIKKGRPFMPIEERSKIVGALKAVDEVITGYDDSDNSSCDALEQVKARYPNDHIIFCNGGDRTQENIPEMRVKDVEFVFSVGGDYKANSSSWILSDWKAPKTERPWGYYRVLHEVPGIKVKELTVNPGQKLSMQRHYNRAEFWMVSEGTASLRRLSASETLVPGESRYLTHDSVTIEKKQWHQLCNTTDKPVKIIEIQYGERCAEEDIERRDLNGR